MDKGTERFLATYRLPKNAERSGLKNFDEISLKVMERYESLSGRSAKKEFCRKYIEHYVDLGFDLEEMLLYLEHQNKTDWYRSNPEWFSLMHLFPIEKEPKIEKTFDMLQYFKAELTKKQGSISTGTGIKIRLRCGNTVARSEYEQHLRECFDMRGGCFVEQKALSI